MNKAERLSNSQFRFPVLDLEVGPLDIPELSAVGSALSVLEPAREVDLENAYVYDTAIPEELRSDLQEGLLLASQEWHWIGGAPNPCQPDPLGYALRDGLAPTCGVAEERTRWVQLLQCSWARGWGR